MKQKCRCGRIATWLYMPGDWDSVACDQCVPRGCSCNADEQGVEERDDHGRLFPCCEWNEYEHGVDDDADWVDYSGKYEDFDLDPVMLMNIAPTKHNPW